MKNNILFLAFLILASSAALNSYGVEIIGDNYNAVSNLTGFALGSGVNSGINPPTTRLTGSAAAGLRYIKTAGNKLDSAHSISTNKMTIGRIATESSTISLSSGSGPYDFGPALNSLAATPGLPSVYDLTISIANAAAGVQRCSFAISSAAGTATAWDFGIQIYRTTTADSGYTVQKRISTAAGGLGAVVNLPITNTFFGTYPNELAFLIRVTDAGAELAPSTNSRVQVSVDGGASWIYDTLTDTTDLPNGWRFPGASRLVYFDVAGGAGPVTYDNFSLNFISGPTSGPRAWNGGGTNDNWSTAANWGGVVPVTGDTLIFNGTTRQTNINDLTDLIVPSVTFNNGGFSLSGNTLTISSSITNPVGNNTFLQNLAWSSVSTKTWGIGSSSELLLNNASAIEVTGDHTILGGGALRLKGSMSIGQATTANPAFIVNEGKHIVDGGTFTSRGGYRIGSLVTGSGAQTILTNGGNFTLTVSGANLRVGDSANPVTSKLLMDNSTITMAGGSVGIPYATGATSQVTQVGGSVSGGFIVFNDNGAGSGSYTIKNGTLEPFQIRDDTASGSSAIYFDNTLLKAAAVANTNFFFGVDLAEIQAGGLTIDAITDVVIAQPLSGTGALVKENFATVILTGANTYSGNSLLNGGKLVFPTTQTNATIVQVANGTDLGVIARSPGSTLSVGGVNFNGVSSNTWSFDLGAFATPTAPLMKVPNLSVSGPVVINVANGFLLTPGQIVLVDYDGAISGGFQFTLGTLPTGVTATLVNNTANSSIDLNITGVPGFRWNGAVNGDWDFSTQNWIKQEDASASAYADGAPTEFLDGAATGIINLLISAAPAVLTVSNNALAYAWNGGAITTPILKKYGTNSLTRGEGVSDSIKEIELNAGAYVVSNSSDATFGTVLTDAGVGSGSFVKQGAGTLTVSTNSGTYDGAIVIQQGILKLGTTNTLGSTNGGTTIASGATLDLNDIIAPHEPVVVSGIGVSGQGAIIDSASATGVAHNLTDVTMVADTTFGGPNGGRWDIRVRSSSGPGPGLKGNGFNLTKVGPGSLSIACQRSLGAATPYWEMNLGDVVIKEGSVTFAESLSLGNPLKTITIESGATLGTFDLALTNPIVRNIIMTNASITAGGSATDTNVLNGSIQLTGVGNLRPNDATLIINGAIQGSGSVTVTATGSGTLFLNGNNTYTGDTVNTNGTLGGTGVIAGNLIMLGGTNSPGAGGVGTLTVNGNVTLGSVTKMELNRSLSPNCDRLAVGGSLSFGGILNVVLGAGAPSPQAGDLYPLFNKGSGTTFSAVNLPDLSALPGGLSWNTNNLTVNGSISVVGTAASPTIGSVKLDGNNFVFSGTGGIEGNSYYVLSSTNIALPVANWTRAATNVFGPGGSFSYTNAINPTVPATFYLLQVP